MRKDLEEARGAREREIYGYKEKQKSGIDWRRGIDRGG